jgi:hypothetical protein
MRSTTFRNVAIGILALAAAYHLGARSAVAQAPGNPVVDADNGFAFTSNGDVYWSTDGGNGSWTYHGNVFSGQPTPATPATLGTVKSRYR